MYFVIPRTILNMWHDGLMVGTLDDASRDRFSTPSHSTFVKQLWTSCSCAWLHVNKTFAKMFQCLILHVTTSKNVLQMF